jgi:hypothetical protein
MNAQASDTKNRNHRQRIWLWILLASLSIFGVRYLSLFFHAYGNAARGTSQAVSELLTRNIPELRQKYIHFQFGSRTTGCNLYTLEHCAILHISEEFLDHPEYLMRMRQVLEHPCEYAISPNEPLARREALVLSAPQDEWLKIYLLNGEPAWHRFGCDRHAQANAPLSWVGPTKIVFNVYRIPMELRKTEIGDLAQAGKLVVQFILYLGD